MRRRPEGRSPPHLLGAGVGPRGQRAGSHAPGCTAPTASERRARLGDHGHFIVEAKDRAALGRGMKALGARLTRAVNRTSQRKGAVLADRYHLRLLRTPKEVRNALRYVLLNARKHVRRVAGRWHCDPASSGRWFHGWKRRPARAAH